MNFTAYRQCAEKCKQSSAHSSTSFESMTRWRKSGFSNKSEKYKRNSELLKNSWKSLHKPSKDHAYCDLSAGSSTCNVGPTEETTGESASQIVPNAESDVYVCENSR